MKRNTSLATTKQSSLKRTPLRKMSEKKAADLEGQYIASTFTKPKGKKKPKSNTPSNDVLDDLFSRYIRRNGECQLWGYGGVQCSSQLQCSHIISRVYGSVCWDVDNAICACAAHHFWQHKHPVQSTLALIELLGHEHLDRLNQKYLNGKKKTPQEKREIAAWLREELRKVA